MAVIYSAATKAARLNAVVSQIGSGGKLKILTTADAQLAEFNLADPAGTVADDLLTFSDANGGTTGILNTTASATGIAAKAIVTTSADVTVISGLTVGTTGADLIVDNTNVNVGQGVTINSATIQHA